MMDNKIILDEDETMLLLITKNHLHKNVPLHNLQRGSIEYIQACCNYRCQTEAAQTFWIYRDLTIKLLSPTLLFEILKEMYEGLSFWKEKITTNTILERIISKLAGRIVTDLILDTSLIEIWDGK